MSICPNCHRKIRRNNSKKIGQIRVHKRCPRPLFLSRAEEKMFEKPQYMGSDI